MKSRAGLVDLSRRFDITWFLGAIHKYRRLLGEVLVASFFLQVFALVSLGGAHFHKSPYMPIWSVTLRPAQIKSLVSYVRSISRTKSQP